MLPHERHELPERIQQLAMLRIQERLRQLNRGRLRLAACRFRRRCVRLPGLNHRLSQGEKRQQSVKRILRFAQICFALQAAQPLHKQIAGLLRFVGRLFEQKGSNAAFSRPCRLHGYKSRGLAEQRLYELAGKGIFSGGCAVCQSGRSFRRDDADRGSSRLYGVQ
jgi:hypothetical protein